MEYLCVLVRIILTGRLYVYSYKEDFEIDNMPVITLNVLANKKTRDDHLQVKIENKDTERAEINDIEVPDPRPKSQPVKMEVPQDKDVIRNDHQEYLTRSDGSVVCRLCGEILQSRIHWYRHKYKQHVPASPPILFQCNKCFVHFKSRKGYIGHCATRHSEPQADTAPVLTNIQAEALKKEPSSMAPVELDKSPGLNYEAAIPKTTLPNPSPVNISKVTPKSSSDTPKRMSKSTSTKDDQNEKRIREERMVTEIIDRVRRECEAQGTTGSNPAARRGYNRKTSTVNT